MGFLIVKDTQLCYYWSINDLKTRWIQLMVKLYTCEKYTVKRPIILESIIGKTFSLLLFLNEHEF